MSKLGTVNGIAVISAARVQWKVDDDPEVRALCDARGLVLFDAGGKSDAICIGDRAILWERNGERFRAFPLPARQPRWPMWCVTLPIEAGLLGFTYDDRREQGRVSIDGIARSIGRDQLRGLRRTLGEWPL